ncbi:AzlC family ABC transporter permease [Actinomycetospora sp. C-140]
MDITLRHTPAAEVRVALRDLASVAVGLAPFAVLIGVTAVRTGAGAGAGVLSSVTVFGGSAQLTALAMIGDGASPLAVIAAVTLVNARFLLYAAALEPGFRDQPSWFRWLAPHFVVDPSYAMASRRPDLLEDPSRFRRYWLTAGLGLAATWVGLTAVGALLAPVLPASSALDVAAPAMFLAVLVPQLRARPARAGAAVAAVVAATASPLPDGLGLLCGIAAGVAAATLSDRSAS